MRAIYATIAIAVLLFPAQDVPIIMPVPVGDYYTYTVILTDSEIDLMARVLYAEARGESPTHQRLIVQVMIDRYINSSDTIHSILTAPKQFAKPCSLDKDYSVQLDVVNAVLLEGLPVPHYRLLFFRSTASTEGWYAPYLFHDSTHAFYGEDRIYDEKYENKALLY